MRRLEGPEIEAYDLIDTDLARRVWILRVPFLAPGTSGMTIARLVMLRSDADRTGRRQLVAHELVHVRQYAALGVPRFLVAYLFDYARGLARHRNHRAAYLAIPTEVEARAEAAVWARRRESSSATQ